jgi:predicted nucleic acid-binding protein
VATGSSRGVAYLDSSALVKLVVDEDESASLRVALAAWSRRASSRLSLTEVLRAVRRHDRGLEHVAEGVLKRTSLLKLSDSVLSTAARLDPPPLRTLDAIHVASALGLGPSLSAFVSYDALQLESAEALGLPVASPS